MAREEGILQMMRAILELSETIGSAGPSPLASPDLTREDAERLLEATVRFLASVDLLCHAIIRAGADEDADEELIESSLAFANLSHQLGKMTQLDAIVQVKRLGGNAVQLLHAAEKRRYLQ